MAELFQYYELNRNQKPFFFAGMCHVCHLFGEGIILKTCGSCNMIQYCGAEHQRDDWASHRDFCSVISQLKEEWNRDHIYQTLKRSTESDESISTLVNEARSRIQLKIALKSEVMRLLERPIESYEMQMMHFPRVCAVCYECKHELLIDCQQCPQSSFCLKHKDKPNHQEVCRKMNIIFSFEKYKKDFPVIESYVKNLNPIPHQTNGEQLPSSIKNFLETYIKEIPEIKNIMKDKVDLVFGILADRLSRPLSLLFAMEKLNYPPRSKIVVHVIGANMEEIMNDWEVILHWLPQLSVLKLVFIGPDVVIGSENMHTICNICKKKRKKLIMEMEISLYEVYFRKSNFQRPDIIVGFNADIYAYSSWNLTAGVLRAQCCPLVLTSYDEIEALRELKKILTRLRSAKCIYFRMNPFASLMYGRSHVNEAVFSKNEFMVIYEHLGIKNG